MSDTTLPEWQTAIVQALCQRMHETLDFSPMPILADALQDAGCTDEKLLLEFRKNASRLQAIKQTAMRCPGEHYRARCFAASWLLGFAEEYGLYDADELFDAAIATGPGRLLVFSGNHGDEAQGIMQHDKDTREEFWRYVGVLTGEAVPKETYETIIYACAC